MRLYIKNMVSLRCKMLVQEELRQIGITDASVDLGVVEVAEKISQTQRQQLKENLHKAGLELLEDQKSILIERIKNVIVDMVHYSEELPKVNYSEYIAQKLDHDYTYLSNVFSEVKGVTIQHFIIQHKIEKVKELLLYGELNLSEISHKMDYSSVAHLSHQFKKVTGMTPSSYKVMKVRQRSSLENI